MLHSVIVSNAHNGKACALSQVFYGKNSMRVQLRDKLNAILGLRPHLSVA